MKYEWDEAKRKQTLIDRGLDFADIKSVNWEEAISIADTRNPYPEKRFVTIAPIAGRLCVFAWCYRNKNTRIISLRKANIKEKLRYEQAKEL